MKTKKSLIAHLLLCAHFPSLTLLSPTSDKILQKKYGKKDYGGKTALSQTKAKYICIAKK